MTGLIISDSHGREGNVEQVIELVKPDILLHLGDYEDQDDLIMATAGCQCEFVDGNCDYSDTYPLTNIVELGRHRIFMTHGHRYGVGFGLEELAEAAAEEDCDVAMYGHTHVPILTEENGITILNPGSIALPRQDGRQPSYATVDVDSTGDLHFSINYLDKQTVPGKRKLPWFW